MSEVTEIDSFCILAEEMKDIVAKLNSLHTRISPRLRESSEWDSTHQISLIQDLHSIRRTVKTLYDDLMSNRLSEPDLVSILLIKEVSQ
jgi:hypothetical protein